MKRLLLALVLGIAVTASAVDLNEVDDLKPLAMRVYGVRKAVAESDTIVRIVLGASFVDARREKDAYRIISPDDPEYAYEKFVRPKDVKAEKESVEFRRPPNFWANNKANLDLRRVENVLTLPVPMKRGCHYSVIAQGLANGTQVTSGTCAAKFTYGTKDEAWDSVDGDSYAETIPRSARRWSGRSQSRRTCSSATAINLRSSFSSIRTPPSPGVREPMRTSRFPSPSCGGSPATPSTVTG